MVRARTRQHLENFKRVLPELKSLEVIESDGTDLIMSLALFGDVMREIALKMAWANVKAEAQMNVDVVGQDFRFALHDVWATMNKLQR